MQSNRLLIAGSAAALAFAAGGCSLFSSSDESSEARLSGTESPASSDALTFREPQTMPVATLTNGRLDSTQSASLQQSYDATLSAFDALAFDLKKHGMNDMEARVLGERANGDAIIIRMFADEGDQTRIAIRIGTQGDAMASQQLLDAIHSQLNPEQLAMSEEPEQEALDGRSWSDLIAMDESNNRMTEESSPQIVELQGERFEIENDAELASTEESAPDY